MDSVQFHVNSLLFLYFLEAFGFLSLACGLLSFSIRALSLSPLSIFLFLMSYVRFRSRAAPWPRTEVERYDAIQAIPETAWHSRGECKGGTCGTWAAKLYLSSSPYAVPTRSATGSTPTWSTPAHPYSRRTAEKYQKKQQILPSPSS